MVKHWHKQLDLGPLITLLLAFSWFLLFKQTPLDLAKEYADIALPAASAAAMLGAGTTITPTPVATSAPPAAQPSIVAHLQASFPFFGSLLEDGTPSSKLHSWASF